MEQGIHKYLGISKKVKVYLDNGAFYFIKRDGETPVKEYEEFVTRAKPDWFPIPQDFIPTPKMSRDEQEKCFFRTMDMNLNYQRGDYVPVIHISNFLEDYVDKLKQQKSLSEKPNIALGGIVPNLLRATKAMPYKKIIESLHHVREEFQDKQLHVFGIGGTATLHLAALLNIDSVDSSGWRNRAARGMIQLPGTGERIIAPLGKWRGREVNQEEEKKLKKCRCPACKIYGLDGLKASKIEGFCNRATHNLWTLIEEARLIEKYKNQGTYKDWYKRHLENTTYRPLIDQVIEMSL
jgi:queuine/archaeosine tRNA-ribosyltransferase